MNNHRELLIEWLKNKCAYSRNVYEDPGYTSYYKREFNIVNGVGCSEIYQPGDIDSELNIEYDEHLHKIDDYIDYILANKTNLFRERYYGAEYDKAYKKLQCMEKKNMVILPGSNHSNANYLYKKLIRLIDDNDITYTIPYVSSNPAVSFKNDHKQAKMKINKENFYYFLSKK